ncbi:MAG: vitamin B12 dependent methionine synthase [bacterium]
METLTKIPFSADTDALMKQAHVEAGSDDAADLAGLIKLAMSCSRPKAAYTVAFIDARDGDTVQIGGCLFTSRALSRKLESVERVFPVIATCGREMDEVFDAKGDMVKEYWWDLIKTHALSAAQQELGDHLRRKFRLGTTVIMRPGSGDAAMWPIEQQKELFALMGDAVPGTGVILMESFLMMPNKTTSGILFQAEKDFRTCEVCHRDTCQSRQAPFNKELWGTLQHE